MKWKRLPTMRIDVRPASQPDWSSLVLAYDPDTPFSVLRYDFLKHSGFEPEMLNEARVGGKVEDRLMARAWLRYRNRVVESHVVFAQAEDRCVWGWHAVYYLGWEIDPATGKIRKVVRSDGTVIADIGSSPSDQR